jgi:phospholipid-binding lipoprotein MlaA
VPPSPAAAVIRGKPSPVPFRPALPAAALLLLAACTPAPPGTDIWDPYEERNRGAHEINRQVDRLTAGENGQVALPAPVRRGIRNFALNMGGPSFVLNSALQGRVDRVVAHSFRFVINSTLGLGGIFDPATEMGVAARRTDFGETLHVWGVSEGAYLELPLIGPSTERDAAGFFIDFLIDPLNQLNPTEDAVRAVAARTTARVLARIGERADYSDFVDALIVESADSYTQSRLLYLQYRRFLLEGGARIDDFDPYDDPYLEDPYAQ